ncbi:MAG: DUF4020 domain-containing protein [Actinomycetota bacterium]|nr:DUF4020 domain-containing protein [Actinomycetota bacterium]
MRIGQIDVPEALLEAQRNGTLVVFAGAGVSMPPPSGYPSFERLAQQIAEGSALPRETNEPPDRFLGRLQNLGVRVHWRARDFLSAPSSRPNRLHGDLLRLLKPESGIRLVTTNFDPHFTTAAGEVLEGRVAVFNAPALPLGNRFDGIVYLHGSVEQDPEELVLTDGDFGRAYLTEGWARRFLQAMFETYTVLFVGYSHNDVVTSYLARGLPPGLQGQRFALTHESDPGRWNLLGISPIAYPLTDAPNRHAALGWSVERWIEIARMGVLDHEQKIEGMVRLPPPLELEAADYIKDALRDPAKARFFARHARGLDWLRWADGQPAFDEMFALARTSGETSTILARWFAQHFASEHPEEAFSLVRRRGSLLPPVLWEEIAFGIASKLSGEDRPDAETVARWVTVLLDTLHPGGPSDSLAYLLEGCRRPEDELTAILLFEYLTEPRSKLGRGFALEGERVRQEIELAGDPYSLRESWDSVFRPNLDRFADWLEPILVGHLQQAHLLLRTTGEADGLWDPLSATRSAIEPHEQDFRDTGVDLLVDAARDTLDWMLEHKPENAHLIIEVWSTYDVPLLKRLAIHGVADSPSLSADEKIEWVLRKEMLYAYGLKHEVFRLLANAYPRASEASQRDLLERVRLGPQGEDARGLEERTREYEAYNLLVWLHQVAPDSSLTTDRFEEMQRTYQGEFEPREHPDLSSYISSIAPTRSPITAEELLSEDTEERVDWLLSYQGDRTEQITRNGLLETVGEAVTRSYPYGRELSSALRERETWESDLWGAILRGWRAGDLTEDQWGGVLDFLIEHPQLYAFAHEISDLLEEGAREDRDGHIPLVRLPSAETLAERLWATLSARSAGAEQHDSERWLGEAINHPGGKLAEFWLFALSRRRAEAGEDWSGLPDEYRRYLGGVLSGTSYAAELGRVVLASQLFFLFSIDADWTRQNVLPLLGWSIDARRAEQVWHGFLSWGRWSEALLPDLMPLYEGTFPHVPELPQMMRRQFTKHLASIAVYGPTNPVEEGWLGRFVVAVEPEDRINWASDIGLILKQLEEDAIRDLWGRWLSEYWSRRNQGIPLPLDPAEMEKMMEWSPDLDPVFPEAAERIRGSAPETIVHSRRLYRRLEQSGYASRYPEAVARLLQYLLPRADETFPPCQQVTAMFPALVESADVPRPVLVQICEELARLGCPSASELRRLLD